MAVIKSLVFAVVRAASLAVAASLVVACSTRRPDGGSGLVPTRTAAPDFAARDARGSVVRLSAFAGSPRVVYFYPKDETPGCTKEACAFRDAWDRYQKANVQIFGVSSDD